MTRTRLERIGWVAIFFCLVVGYVFLVLSAQNHYQTSTNYDRQRERAYENCKNIEGKPFWQRVDCDPSAYFTEWLTIFTAVLSAVSLVQFGFVIRADKTARISADAALAAARSASMQTKHMERSTAESARAAAAMEIVAQGISANVETSRNIAETQRDFWKIQMRAYASIRYAATVPQDQNTNWRTEVRLQIVNTGHTPAYELFYKSWCDIHPFPLPEDFDFYIPNLPDQSAGTLAAGQNFIIAASVPRMCSKDEIAAYINGSKQRIYIYGVVIYADVFGRKHETRFSQSVIWLKDGSTMGINTRRHNHAD